MRAAVLLPSLLAALAVTPVAHATTFGPVRAVSATGVVGDPEVGYRPDGSLRVAWARSVRRGGVDRFQEVVRRGPSVERLGPPHVVARPQDVDPSDGAAAPGPTGWRVSCRTTPTRDPGPVRGPVRCRVRRPGGAEGADVRVADHATDLDGVAVQPDGRLVVVTRAPAARGSVTLMARVADAAGDLGAPASLGAVPEGSRSSIAVDAAGTALLVVVLTRGDLEPGRPVLRALPIGAPAFGPAQALTADTDIAGAVDVRTGPGGTAFVLTHLDTAPTRPSPTLVLRSLDGRLGAPEVAPGAVARFAQVDVALPLGGPPAVLTTAYSESETDCGNRTVGRLTASAPGRPGTTPLSRPAQIVEDATLLARDDGGAVAVWEDAAGRGGRTQVEAAFRDATGAWSRGHAFGPRTTGGFAAGADGRRVALAWSTGRLGDGPARIVVSESTTDGRPASSVARPHPSLSHCQ